MDLGEYCGYCERGVELFEVIFVIFEMDDCGVVGVKFLMDFVYIFFLDDEESNIYVIFCGLDDVWEGDVFEFVGFFEYLVKLSIG